MCVFLGQDLVPSCQCPCHLRQGIPSARQSGQVLELWLDQPPPASQTSNPLTPQPLSPGCGHCGWILRAREGSPRDHLLFTGNRLLIQVAFSRGGRVGEPFSQRQISPDTSVHSPGSVPLSGRTNPPQAARLTPAQRGAQPPRLSPPQGLEAFTERAPGSPLHTTQEWPSQALPADGCRASEQGCQELKSGVSKPNG